MSYYPEPDSHIKAVLDLPSYATKKNWTLIHRI